MPVCKYLFTLYHSPRDFPTANLGRISASSQLKIEQKLPKMMNNIPNLHLVRIS